MKLRTAVKKAEEDANRLSFSLQEIERHLIFCGFRQEDEPQVTICNGDEIILVYRGSEMNETFIATLEGILNVCDKTTSGNVSHNIATIKGKCRNMLQFYNEFPVSPWHSVADGDLPKLDTVVLVNTKEYGVITARYDEGWVGVEVPLFYSADCARTANEVNYWMEIPQLPKESEVSNG